MIQVETCWVVRCDRCDAPTMYGGDEGVVHADSEESARALAQDFEWATLDSGKVYCPECADGVYSICNCCERWHRVGDMVTPKDAWNGLCRWCDAEGQGEGHQR